MHRPNYLKRSLAGIILSRLNLLGLFESAHWFGLGPAVDPLEILEIIVVSQLQDYEQNLQVRIEHIGRRVERNRPHQGQLGRFRVITAAREKNLNRTPVGQRPADGQPVDPEVAVVGAHVMRRLAVARDHSTQFAHTLIGQRVLQPLAVQNPDADGEPRFQTF